jgi:Fe-S oxidoreductase
LRVLPREVPVVVLEPGCLSVFRDELPKLIPGARVPAISFAELLSEMDFRPEPVGGQVVLHGHCHQKALLGVEKEIGLLKSAGCEVLAPDTGCCGMAGSFGYRPEFYETSKKIFGLELAPALHSSSSAKVVADGFSCREQIEGLAGRPTLHLAQLLQGKRGQDPFS